MKFKETMNNFEKIRLLLAAIIMVVVSTPAISCQVYSDRQVADNSQSIDTASVLTPCQETVITIDLTAPETLDDAAGAIIVNDLTVTECAAEFNKSEKTLKKSLTTALGYEIIDHNQVENPPRGEKY
jgi:hypothetical protein